MEGIDKKSNASETFTFLMLENNEVPLYQQIHDQVVIAIAEGKLSENHSLPTTRQLAVDFGINFHTVNKAYELLRQDGFVSLTRKQGSVVRRAQSVNEQQMVLWRSRMKVLLAEAVSRGLTKQEIDQECSSIVSNFRIK